MISLLVYVVIVLIVAGLVLWALSQFPIDATIYRLIRVVIIVVAVIVVIYLLLALLPGTAPKLR
jgi:NADH:ubiquinone oxidoreductase subunit 6 (subunit J)